MEQKVCGECQKTFERPIGCSTFNWDRKKVCSRECNYQSMRVRNKGVCSNTGRTHFKKGVSGSLETQFKKGDTSYWKGKKNPHFSGENNPRWNGGIYPDHLKVRHSTEMRQWREDVFKRDNFTCVLCGRKRKKGDRVVLHADHIKPFAQFPELRLTLENGRTLCRECHLKTDTHGVNLKK